MTDDDALALGKQAFDKLIATMRQLEESGVPADLLARAAFGIGVRAMTHQGLTVTEIQAEVADFVSFIERTRSMS